MSDGQILFAEHEHVFVIKLNGAVKFDLGSALEIAVNEVMSAAALTSVLIDMTQTTMLDSTILGILAKMAIIVNERFTHRVSLITANEDVYKILLSVGFDKLFVILGQAQEDEADFIEIKSISEPERVITQRVLAAHKALIKLNEENKIEFQDVIDILLTEIPNKV